MIKMGMHLLCRYPGRLPLMASIIVLVSLTSTSAVPVTKNYKDVSSSTPTMSIQVKLESLLDWKVLSDNSVYSQTTKKPDAGAGRKPSWQSETMAPWIDQETSQMSQYDSGLKIDSDIGLFDLPTRKPVHFDFDNIHVHNNGWDDDDSKMGSYTWITMAVVLVVFFKMTVIAIMIARRMRQGQHHVVIRSSNTSSVTLPNEFTSDQAHLVTPANIVYVDTSGVSPPAIPQLFTPPPYCESLLPNTETSLAINTDEDPPPYTD